MNSPDLHYEEEDANRIQHVYLSHLSNHASSSSLETFPASFVEPHAYWSHLEKASFFKSLARHSRWKPDLIAEDIGGNKTVADVCSYIALLEQASARESGRRCKRDAYPIAHELSEEWVAMENAVAGYLCGKEAEWQEASLKHKRAQELKEVKKSLHKELEIVRGSGSEDDELATSEKRKRKHHKRNQDNVAWKERFKARKRGLGDLWKREDMLSSLDERHLKTMDKMVRTLETLEADKTIGGEGRLEFENLDSDKRAQPNVSASSWPPCDADTPPGDQPLELMSNTNDVASQIDPILLAVDRAVTNPPLHPSDKFPEPVASTSQVLRPTVLFAARANASETSRVEDSKGVSHSLQAQSWVAEPVPQTPYTSPTSVTENPAKLSPTSRRRLQKRLWTRRKRAMESGLPISEVPMDTGILKRGRKAKFKAVNEVVKPNESVSETHVNVNLPRAPKVSLDQSTSQGPLNPGARDDNVNEAEDEQEGTDGSQSAHVKKPYGWSKLMARQVSGESLRTDGMDLFHLEKLAKIMSLLGRVHALSNEVDFIKEFEDANMSPSALSYPFLRLLRVCLIRFVTCLVAYTILHKDVETRQKRRIPGIFKTGGADEIRAENIREALLHMNKNASTTPFFTRLKHIVRNTAVVHTTYGKETGPEFCDTDDPEEMGTSDDGSCTGDKDDTTLSVRSNRVFEKVFSPTYPDIRSASPLFWGPNVLSAFCGKEEHSVLPDEMDEAGLLKELRSEEKIEEADHVADQMHERELWTEIGVKRVEEHDSVTQVTTKRTNALSQKPEGTETSRYLNTEAGPSYSLRYRPPGGAVKSRVYIDSDEDL